MGFSLEDKQQSQVSMNLLDYNVTSIRTVFDRVAELAAAKGVEVVESELIGLAPAAAIDAELAAQNPITALQIERAKTNCPLRIRAR